MECWPVLLLWGLPQMWASPDALRSPGPSDRHFPAAPPSSAHLRCLQISSFANSSWTRTDGSAWLGALQTHSWSNGSDIHFLRPWSQAKLSDHQWEQLQQVFWVYRSSFNREVREFAKMLHLDYPLEIQVSAGCEVHPGSPLKSFFHSAFQGSDLLSFQGTFWVPAPNAPHWAEVVSNELNKDQYTRDTVEWLISDICPQVVTGLLEAGQQDLEKQVKPEAWLSSGPPPGPGRLLLVCHVSGFYPEPVWVRWMRGQQEQPGAQQGDVLPNADGTWYLRVTLDVAAGEAAGLTCRVRHSSLGGQDIVLYWEGSHVPVGWIVAAVLASLLLVGGGITFWLKKRRSYQDIL
ncbi:antigen-presenting glycoprotein CD1d-like isoform X2 [Myotis lucifugus]|uniref:antigen-presenting glycoprotein CD1d-like isoform X2 n=1 Tax=Myotis lucifugus TaxID=59463 RepID=UPI0003C45E6B|nr:antigen-presenting glycoprotein CD1d-like isoform X2 [Myotis lucifugus]